MGSEGMQSKSLWWVGLFAVAMAYLESAVVVYLRKLYGISDLILSVPPFDPQIGAIELGRELATNPEQQKNSAYARSFQELGGGNEISITLGIFRLRLWRVGHLLLHLAQGFHRLAANSI